MNNHEEVKRIIEEEYSNNFQEMRKLNSKICTIRDNEMDTKLFYVLGSAFVTSTLMLIIYDAMPVLGLISKRVLPVLFGVGSIGVGIVMEKTIHKLLDRKEKFSNAKTHKEMLEECMGYEIENQKLWNLNQSLCKSQIKLSESNDYHSNVEGEISSLDHRLKQQQEELDTISTKQTLLKFYSEGGRFNLHGWNIYAMLGLVTICNIPILGLSNAGLQILISYLVGGITFLGYHKKLISDYREVIDKINQKLETKAIADFKNFKEETNELENELKQWVSDTCDVRLELESKKRELESINAIEKEENKYSYHYTDAMDRSVDDDKTETEKKGYVHKRVKE